MDLVYISLISPNTITNWLNIILKILKIFIIGVESNYVNSTFGVRVRFYGIHETETFELEIDRLRLDYTDYS